MKCLFSECKRCPLNATVHDFVYTQHFEGASTFWEVAGDQLGIGNDVADHDTRHKLHVEVRFSEPREVAVTKLLMTFREQLSVQGELLGVRAIGSKQCFDIFGVVCVQLCLDDREWGNC